MHRPQRNCMIAFIAVSILAASPSIAQKPPGPEGNPVGAAAKLSFEPYTLRTFDGREHAAEIGRLSVPESRASATPSRPMIQLGFVRLKSSAPNPGSPIVFLMGGPGVPGSVMGQVPPYWSLFDRLRAVGDVILLDQRGLGLSRPNIDCPPASSPPPPELLSSNIALLGVMRSSLSECATHWRASGVDPRAYSVESIADDVEDLRRALGVERVSLLGFSYGTRLALEFIRRHPAHVDRVVLAGTLGVDQTIKLPGAFDRMLGEVSKLVSADESFRSDLPDLVGEVSRVLASVERKQITVTITNRAGQPVTLSIAREGLQAVITGRLGDRRLPALIATLKKGDYSVLTRLAEGIYNDLASGGGSLMARAVVCSAPSSPQRSAQAKREALQAVLGEPFDNLAQSVELCGSLGGVPVKPAPQAAVRSRRPILFVTGTLDDRTPIENAEQTKLGFPNSIHVIVENGGHETIPIAVVQEAISDFCQGKELKTHRLVIPKPSFASIEQARLPQRPPGR